MADRFRGWPPRGVHVLLAPPRHAPCSLMKASASLTRLSSRHFTPAILFHASTVTGKTVTAAEPNHPNRASLSDSPKP